MALAMLSILAFAAPVAAKPGGSNSGGSTACANGGYLNYTRTNGTTFKNEGDCTNYTAKGGALVAIDRTAPTVINVTSSTADGTYGAGEVISVQVVFSETVTVTGNPVLTLETGANDATANYNSGSGSSSLTLSYAVQAGHASTDLNYSSATALALGGGLIRDAAGNDAALTLPAPGAAGSLGANKAIVIDPAVELMTWEFVRLPGEFPPSSPTLFVAGDFLTFVSWSWTFDSSTAACTSTFSVDALPNDPIVGWVGHSALEPGISGTTSTNFVSGALVDGGGLTVRLICKDDALITHNLPYHGSVTFKVDHP